MLGNDLVTFLGIDRVGSPYLVDVLLYLDKDRRFESAPYVWCRLFWLRTCCDIFESLAVVLVIMVDRVFGVSVGLRRMGRSVVSLVLVC